MEKDRDNGENLENVAAYFGEAIEEEPEEILEAIPRKPAPIVQPDFGENVDDEVVSAVEAEENDDEAEPIVVP